MQKAFTGIKDTDLIILSQLDDKDLLSTCLVNKEINKLCKNENFWRNRFITQNGQKDFEFMKDKVKNWRKFMLLLIKYLDMGRGYYYYALRHASEGGHKELVDLFIHWGSKNWDEGMEYAAKGGHKDLVDFFISKGANKWNFGMYGAIEGGHRELVDFFISKGANHWENGMFIAAEKGDKELVDFFISKGAHNWNEAMFSAIRGGNKDLVDFFISKGADDWPFALEISESKRSKKNEELIKFFKSKMNNLFFLK